MIIFVYGENTYSSQKKIEVMRDQFKRKFDSSGMNLVEFSTENREKIEIGNVVQAIQSPPFLSEKRMVIVKNLVSSLKKPEAKPWIEQLSKIIDTTILIFWDTESVKKLEKRELFKQFSGETDVHTYNYPQLIGNSLLQWAQTRVHELGLIISAPLLSKVIAMIGTDIWQLSNELEKLKARSSDHPVTELMVTELVKAQFEDQIFAFLDAVSLKNTKEALRLLNQQRLSGSSDFQLFSLLARQVRILLSIRYLLDENSNISSQSVASSLGLHPFVAQKSLTQARKMSTETLNSLHGSLFLFDKQMKRSGILVDVAVDRVVLSLLNS